MASNSDTLTCCICLLNITDITMQTESCRVCNQFFHNQCICNWIKNNDTCPHCRSTMWGNMLLDASTIIYHFTKFKTYNRIRFSNGDNIIDEHDDLQQLLTIIQPPSENLLSNIKLIIHQLREWNLETLFRRMLTVPTYAKLDCNRELAQILPSEKPEYYDICLLYVYIFYRGGYQDTITEQLLTS